MAKAQTAVDIGKAVVSTWEDAQNKPLSQKRVIYEAGLAERHKKYVETHHEICTAMDELFISKNTDYGSSFEQSIDELGTVAAIARLEDKFNRIKTLLLKNKDRKVKDETVIDTLRDMANYSVMLASYLSVTDPEIVAPFKN